MKDIVDYGKQGGENLDVQVPEGIDVVVANPELQALISNIKQCPRRVIETDTDSGVKRPVDVRLLPLSNPTVFGWAHKLATYEPMVYASTGGKTSMGMLSLNHDTTGTYRLPTLKVIPLQQAYPLNAKLDPDAAMATMLAGAVSAERAGVGGHEGPVTSDFEHQATILGAVSLGNSDLAINHANHGVRESGSSVATGLANGSLGNLYVPDAAGSGFTGYGDPVIIKQETVRSRDMLMIPDRWLDSEAAWGGTYVEASRIMMGAGLQVLHNRYGSDGPGLVQRELNNLASRVT